MKDIIISEFQNLSFSRIEAVVYYTLVKYGELNGSQISKFSRIPRSSVYPALDNLYQKGAVILMPSTEPKIYKAENIANVVEILQNKFSRSSELVVDELSKMQKESSEEHFWNFNGINHFNNKAIEFMRSAQEEVVIHFHYDFKVFEEEIRAMCNRGVRVIIFSYNNFDIGDLPIEFYFNPKFEKSAYSMLEYVMTVDYKKVLLAYGAPNQSVHGIYTNNPYLIQTLSTYIHWDIYMQNLEKKMNVNLITPDVQINTLHEKVMKEVMALRDKAKIRDYSKYK